MRTLVVDDVFFSRLLAQRIISPFGECDGAASAKEALEAFRLAWEEGQPYDLILLDILMPEMDGHAALAQIRDAEKEMGVPEGVKVIMLTGVVDHKNVSTAFMGGCAAYVPKPVEKEKLLAHIRQLGLIGEK